MKKSRKTALNEARAGTALPPTSSQASSPSMTVVRQIDELIESGELIPGQRLIENDLMDQLSATRSAVREALRYLAGDGVVELLPNRGARIALLSRSRLCEMFEVLGGIFRTALGLIASKPIAAGTRKAILAALRGVVDAASTRSSVTMMDSMVGYYLAVAQHCGNGYLYELVRKMHLYHYSRQVSLNINVDDMVEACRSYVAVTDMILKRDAEGAYAMLVPNTLIIDQIGRKARSS